MWRLFLEMTIIRLSGQNCLDLMMDVIVIKLVACKSTACAIRKEDFVKVTAIAITARIQLF